jgi:hypothetical protein
LKLETEILELLTPRLVTSAATTRRVADDVRRLGEEFEVGRFKFEALGGLET